MKKKQKLSCQILSLTVRHSAALWTPSLDIYQCQSKIGRASDLVYTFIHCRCCEDIIVGVPEEQEEEDESSSEHNDIKKMMVKLLLLEIQLVYNTCTLSI